MNSEKYKMEFAKHRETTVAKLYKFTMSFIDSINSNLFCFPSSLGWLVSHIYNLLTNKHPKTSQATQQNDVNKFSELLKTKSSLSSLLKARRICCDLIMSLYISPAICDPG